MECWHLRKEFLVPGQGRKGKPATDRWRDVPKLGSISWSERNSTQIARKKNAGPKLGGPMQKASPRFQLEQNRLVSKGAYSYIIQYDSHRNKIFDHKG